MQAQGTAPWGHARHVHAEIVAGAPVVRHGELIHRRRPVRAQLVMLAPDGQETGAGRRARIPQEADLAVDRVLAERDPQPEGQVPVRSVRARVVGPVRGLQPRALVRCRQPVQPARRRDAGVTGFGRFLLLSHGQRQLHIGQDAVGGLHVQGLHGDQGPCGPAYRSRHREEREIGGSARMPLRGLRIAQLGLGQQPQEGFRTLTVHVPSVHPPRRTAWMGLSTRSMGPGAKAA